MSAVMRLATTSLAVAVAGGCLSPEETLPPAKAPSACVKRSGTWRMTQLSCDARKVDLAGAGIQSFEVTFPTVTTARTSVQFASGCRLVADSTISTDGGWVSAFNGETCAGGCSNAECDGAVPQGSESWTCESSAFENSMTLRATSASICRGTATEQLWIRQ